MRKRETLPPAGFCFFAGTFPGLLTAPIKGGVECGNNTRHQHHSKKDAPTGE